MKKIIKKINKILLSNEYIRRILYGKMEEIKVKVGTGCQFETFFDAYKYAKGDPLIGKKYCYIFVVPSSYHGTIYDYTEAAERRISREKNGS